MLFIKTNYVPVTLLEKWLQVYPNVDHNYDFVNPTEVASFT